jgi:dUTP pyrophosphatase
MNKVKVDIINRSSAPNPKYQTSHASGADLHAFLLHPSHFTYKDSSGVDCINIEPGEHRLIHTGIKVRIPDGYEIQVRARSGLALKYGITVLNGIGTLDSDYTGEVGVILINHSSERFTIRNNDRIAQLVLAPVVQAEWVDYHSDEFESTDRNPAGFGSTNIR